MIRNTQCPGHPGHLLSGGVAVVLTITGGSEPGAGSDSGFCVEGSDSVGAVASVSVVAAVVVGGGSVGVEEEVLSSDGSV